jgi:hypothetical protein
MICEMLRIPFPMSEVWCGVVRVMVRVMVRTIATRAVATVVVALALVVGGAALGPVTSAFATPPTFTGAFLHGEQGSYVFSGQASYATVTVGSYPTSVYADFGGYHLDLVGPGQTLPTVGTYHDVALVGTAGPTQFGVNFYGNGMGCGSSMPGSVYVDEIAWSGSTLTALAARFEVHCEGVDRAIVGAVAYNATVPYHARTYNADPLDFGNVASNQTAQLPVTITNTGNAPLTITSNAITGTDAAAFSVLSSTCLAAPIAVSQSCTVTVDFAPGQLGSRAAKLTIFDDVAPVGGTGDDVTLTGNGVAPPDPSGELTPLTPVRIMDSRDGTGQGAPGPLVGGTTRDLQVTGVGGVPTSGVTAVIVNATITEPTASGFMTIWPTGVPRPTVSNLNFVPGQTVPNLVTVAVGASGRVSLFMSYGSAHVVVDVVGFYASSTGPNGSRFHSTTPSRVIDTRAGGPMTEGGTLALKVTGVNGVPASGVTAVTLNFTVTNPSWYSVLTVYPGDVSRPVASNLNFAPGQTIANLVTVRVPANGVIDVWNMFGTTDVVVDVAGYYDGDRSTEHGRFQPIGPGRVFDTRDSGLPLGQDDYIYVTANPNLGDIDSFVVNVTAVTPTMSGYLTVFPSDVPSIPNTSNLNFAPGQIVPNLVIARLSKVANGPFPVKTFIVLNRIGYTHVVLDVFGYFT